ncbi:hypothetical protein E2542_SST05168 [Spatholobus suberectus]|nr:hypothetical protein E2542_SST05168 [Spatholobus suberectus]
MDEIEEISDGELVETPRDILTKFEKQTYGSVEKDTFKRTGKEKNVIGDRDDFKANTITRKESADSVGVPSPWSFAAFGLLRSFTAFKS